MLCQQRSDEINQWLTGIFPAKTLQLTPLAGDASFRRYLRLAVDGQSYVVMDAPLEHEALEPYIQLTALFRQHRLNVPEIFAQNRRQGLLLLQDFGDDLLLRHLNAETVDHYYGLAFAILQTMQTQVDVNDSRLLQGWPDLLMTELMLFPEWYLRRYLQLKLTMAEEHLLQQLFSTLIDVAVEQPQVCVHRDFHSRNLLLDKKQLAIIDFQDACVGSITYDLVSLLKDCYIDWPRDRVEAWVEQYRQQSTWVKLPETAVFLRWFDLMGLQRHLKVLGIFSRLHLRDGKEGYLQDIPRILQYVQQVCQCYPELAPLADFFATRVMPCVR